MQSKAATRIVCIGGGHCNVQVLKMLKQVMPNSAKLTVVTEAPNAYYSGMLPGAVSGLYTDDQIQIQIKPLAQWCNADYIEERVHNIKASENKINFESGGNMDYDLLAINVGSRTRGANETPGVKEYSLSTRPINDLLSKIQKREKELIESKTIPEVVVCGSGAAGVEMAFGFKKRWSKLFNKEIKVAIVCPSSEIFPGKQNDSIRAEILRKFSEKNIAVHYDAKVKEIQKNSVVLQDGRVIPCDVPVWATGAEAQKVTMRSDLDVMNDYFRVNDYMQSTSHSNVFAGGDCVTMENYSHDRFPPKAGVYAVRAGPIIAQNLVNSILDKPLVKYVPQSGFLALLMTADEKAIGSKFGIAFAGKWVWKMKDRIDTSFMKLFDPMYLYKDYAKFGCAFPVENNNLFENELYGDRASSERIKERVFKMSTKEGALSLLQEEEAEEFYEQFFVLDRMAKEQDFCKDVVENFRSIKNAS
eukprot:403345372